MRVCVCVCVCVRQREKDTETERQREDEIMNEKIIPSRDTRSLRECSLAAPSPAPLSLVLLYHPHGSLQHLLQAIESPVSLKLLAILVCLSNGPVFLKDMVD